MSCTHQKFPAKRIHTEPGASRDFDIDACYFVKGNVFIALDYHFRQAYKNRQINIPPQNCLCPMTRSQKKISLQVVVSATWVPAGVNAPWAHFRVEDVILPLGRFHANLCPAHTPSLLTPTFSLGRVTLLFLLSAPPISSQFLLRPVHPRNTLLMLIPAPYFLDTAHSEWQISTGLIPRFTSLTESKGGTHQGKGSLP